MVQLIPFNSSISSNILLESKDPRSPFASSSFPKGVPSSRIHCSSSYSRNHAYIPKLEPFSRSKLERVVKDPPLIQKSESQLADYCSTLDGDASYDCWKAYFELKDLEKESPKEEVERLIVEAGGMKSLIGCVHGIAEIHKAKKESTKQHQTASSGQTRRRACLVPDGLPKSREEIEEEESTRMPDSPFTRLLRTKGTHPAWYTPALDY